MSLMATEPSTELSRAALADEIQTFIQRMDLISITEHGARELLSRCETALRAPLPGRLDCGEPVAWRINWDDGNISFTETKPDIVGPDPTREIVTALYALPPTLNSGADREAIARSGTFLGYRDANGFEMHCANAFCPDQAKCNQGCINPVPRRALPRAVQGGEVESDEVLALQIHRIAGCQVGSERCKNIIKWYRSKATRAVEGGAAEQLRQTNAVGYLRMVARDTSDVFDKNELKKIADTLEAALFPNTGDGK